jgi:hypothetical protein
MGMKRIGVTLLLLSGVAGVRGMPPGGDAYMQREWQRRSDSLFVAEVRKTDAQLPTWWAMPEPKGGAPSTGTSGTRYVDPRTGLAKWDFAGYYYTVRGTLGNNTTGIPNILILPADSVNSNKGLQRVK